MLRAHKSRSLNRFYRFPHPRNAEELIRLFKIAHTEYEVSSIIFGDIDLQPHLEWEISVCAKASVELSSPNCLTPYLPLWLWPRRKVLEKFVLNGEKPVQGLVVCVDNKKMKEMPDGKTSTWYLGKILDKKMMEECEESGVDACGENGEFHTFVVSCPSMKIPLWRNEEHCPEANVTKKRIVINEVRNEKWKSSHSFLDVDAFLG